MDYQELWERFIKGDHVSQARLPSDGTVGLALVIPIESRGIVERIVAVQRRIGKVVPFVQVPRKALHVTVAILGNLQDEAAPSEESSRRISALDYGIRDALKTTERFEVILKRVNSFFTSAFAEMTDHGAIRRMGERVEERLNALRIWEQDYGGGTEYVSHLTLGYYGESGDGAAVRAVLSELRDTEFGTMTVDRVSFVAAEWKQGQHTLQSIGEYALD